MRRRDDQSGSSDTRRPRCHQEGRLRCVLDVINKLCGKPKKFEQVAPNQFRAESEKDAAVVSGNVKNLLQNPIIIENLNITFAAPGNHAIRDRREHLPRGRPRRKRRDHDLGNRQVARSVCKRVQKPGDELKENVNTVWVNPHRGPFTGEPGQRWFKRGGGKPFTATINGKGFLESYGQGEPRLNAEDLLEVELLERQKISDGKLTTSYTILKVTGYRPGARWRRLPFAGSKRTRKRR